ncbi:hypothetical protein WN48_04043 [Eufriesea mexicana]|uniref:Uncharacterized protein n=1 Tax=Eufriesea mexicana TaxID=516756 RepID=A0A310SP64_9HYME|nr:hypothetical protein WN48_04043 [Eufriesea mexicana]
MFTKRVQQASSRVKTWDCSFPAKLLESPQGTSSKRKCVKHISSSEKSKTKNIFIRINISQVPKCLALP